MNTESDTRATTVTWPQAGSDRPFDPGLWNHPALALYLSEEVERAPQSIPKKLYLVPTPNTYAGESDDRDFAPQPSSAAELPHLDDWVERFVISIVEIWGGRRHPMQLARWCHRSVHAQLVRKSGSMKEIPRVRKIYLSEPIDGVCESTVTLRINERVRSLALRFEGVDKRWLCTEMILL